MKLAPALPSTLIKSLCLPGLALLYACAATPPPSSGSDEGAAVPARQPVSPAHNRGSVVFAPAVAPDPIDSTLLLDRKSASVSLRAILGSPRQGRHMALRQYKVQFRNAGPGAVSISEVMLQTGATTVPIEMGSAVVPTGKGYTLSFSRQALNQVDPREDAFLTFRYEGRRFQALIHGHQLVYVVEAPG
ncbi:hypothetical protein FKG94_26410 [Exilibacterium tricleocarpae]|uniref:Copper chaperone PCu(A)C n=1 Tax=Exilibacterium tricleocarpae TaxID=2591008 RepID=A0A545SPX4_9GAMM|nr:hypothetical protein [Exilibacterium tricleocarpae]TQV67004.1 hypothetical protein FKG94_26410 [Exilibacterium tricleocarpae]